MDITILKKLGLSDKELKIYFKLLEHSALSVRNLAELTNLNRGTVYEILKKLQKIGLVSYYHKETKQKFVAEDPERIEGMVRDREEELSKLKNKVIELIPELKSLKNKGGDKPTVKFYESQAGIKIILEDILASMDKQKQEKEYYIYSATNASEDINGAYPNFTKDRIKKKIKVKSISLAKGGGIHGLDERRWLGVNEESAVFILIYYNKYALISRDSKNTPVGVIIENEMIYQTQKIIFLQLWKLLRNKK